MDAQTLYKAVLNTIPHVHKKTRVPRHSVAIGILLGGGNHEVSDSRIYGVPWEELTDTVYVAGTRNDPSYTLSEILTLLKGRPKTFAWQGCNERWNTSDQMRWLTTHLQAEKRVSTLILSTSDYHLPRCVLTFIKMWLQSYDYSRKLELMLLPTPHPKLRGETSTNQTVDGELTRIATYQEKGHVATAAEFFDFIRRNHA